MWGSNHISQWGHLTLPLLYLPCFIPKRRQRSLHCIRMFTEMNYKKIESYQALETYDNSQIMHWQPSMFNGIIGKYCNHAYSQPFSSHRCFIILNIIKPYSMRCQKLTKLKHKRVWPRKTKNEGLIHKHMEVVSKRCFAWSGHTKFIITMTWIS